MNESRAREEICRVGASLFARGYAHATAGNISVRLDEGAGFLITPTDACLGFLDPARLARLDGAGRQLAGDRASKTIALHTRIYAAATRFDAATRCVIHTHSTHCVALTLNGGGDSNGDVSGNGASSSDGGNGSGSGDGGSGADGSGDTGELLPALTPYFVMKVGRVPVIPYHRPGSPVVAEAVARAITRYGERGAPVRAVMLARLGPNVWHNSPDSAMATLEELEETAKLWRLAHAAQPAARPTPLSDAHIEELRQTFGARW